MIEVRPATADDIPALERVLGPPRPERHRRRLRMQEEDRATYLIALDAGEPVGHVLASWEGEVNEHVRENLAGPPCPEVEELRVVPERRRKGIGSRLMDAAEEEAARRGFSRMGLGVGTWNEAARALYDGRGYREAGVPPFDIGDSGVSEDGEPWSWSETVVYLVKELAPTSSPEP